MKKGMKMILSQFKFELIIVSLSVIYVIFESWLDAAFPLNRIEDYFNKIDASEKSADIIAFIAIAIGIYISVITIISTSRIPASKKILENNLEGKLLFFVFVAVSVNMVDILYLLFVPDFKFYVVFYFMLLLIQISILIKFLMMIIYLCKINIEEVVNDIDEQADEKKELFNIISEIRDELKK